MIRRDPSTVQMRHPKTGRWWLVNTDTNQTIRSAVARWVNVPVRPWTPGATHRQRTRPEDVHAD